MSSVSRPTRALISRSALVHNLKLLQTHTRTPVMGVVKAQGYGHGLHAAHILAKAGVSTFGVATLEEALELRSSGVDGEVMILGALDEHHLALAARHRVGITAWNRQYLAAASKHPLAVHLKVDTGMLRLGFVPGEIQEVLDAFRQKHYGRLRLSSAYTHFACADEARDRVSEGQMKLFKAVSWPKGLRLHVANSAAALRYSWARLDMVRSGIFLYGAQEKLHPLVKKSLPVLSLTTRAVRVAELKKGQGVSYGHTFKASKAMKVATLCIGYADGVPRLLSNRGSVLMQGKRCRILGRVCMDFIMVDVSTVKNVRPGDEAILIGRQGRESIAVGEWAKLCQTNTYEILCGISSRVPRDLAD